MSDIDDNKEEKVVDPLDLSDEEFAKLDLDTLVEPEETKEDETTASAEEEEEDKEEVEEEKETEEEEEISTKEEATSEDDETNTEKTSKKDETEIETESTDKPENKNKSKKVKADSEKEETSIDSEKENKEDTKEEIDSDYKGQIEKLLSPFKANGKDIKVDNVDDAITLMQMGANYNKKMAGLKPSLKLLKMLENNNLLDESKLSYLIDLNKKDPEAIKKLVKDSGIDPLDIDVKEKTEYKPKSYTVDDKEVDLDGILGDIQDTDSYKETLNIISNKWDDSSKEALYSNPNIIKILNGHVESGVYQQISGVIESERMLGRLTGLTDIEAYQQVGKAIEAQGGFKPTKSTVETTQKTSTKKTVDPKLKQRKKAASSTKSTVSKKKEQQTYNPLSLSDAEFEKINVHTL